MTCFHGYKNVLFFWYRFFLLISENVFPSSSTYQAEICSYSLFLLLQLSTISQECTISVSFWMHLSIQSFFFFLFLLYSSTFIEKKKKKGVDLTEHISVTSILSDWDGSRPCYLTTRSLWLWCLWM